MLTFDPFTFTFITLINFSITSRVARVIKISLLNDRSSTYLNNSIENVKPTTQLQSQKTVWLIASFVSFI